MAKGNIRNIPYESDEEMYFLLWAFELKDKGIISSIDRGESIELFDGYKESYTKTTILKTKTKVEEKTKTILNPHIYTPDFKIIWASNPIFPEAKKGCNYSLIEVKPDFDQNNMERAFKINQKWVFDKLGIYITLIKPNKLFAETFTPTRYLITNKSGKGRKIKHKVVMCDEWLISEREQIEIS